ncbi:MAG: DUF2778 domain-containing protein [Bradyrhizobium sp.]|uniref:DUF2778 domain-containing protein n=1 Tax=Bradyrhizobium sp. TaxID=376 RepID=UPI00121101BA|nr:tlde1 domain-containing protein [Bradyrhizobium sp.]THD65299.1 MAG: DUF2778 domain-containing protein [Bradyrhizobium sp.]
MSTSTSACYGFAAHHRKRSSQKAFPHALFASAAVGFLVLGCAWTVYSNVLGASVYPTLSSSNFDSPVVKRPAAVAARSPATIIDNVFAALPAPMISAPTTVASGPSLSFEDRFAAAAPQGAPSRVAETPKPPDAPKLADASRPQEAPRSSPASSPRSSETPKLQVVASLPPDRQVAAAPPPAARPADVKPAKGAGASLKDMAQRAKAAVMSIASNEKQTIVEKLWGKPQPQHGPSLLSFASADASLTGSLGSTSNPALAGNTPRYDQSTAVYDIAAHTVYLPDGTQLEAHSGLGSALDDPHSARIRMRGVTPPHLYDLTPRESLFHGVPALRLNPVGGEDAIYGRSGLLAHTFMLGTRGDSNGCVSFRDYNAFLNAYRNQGIKRLAVVEKID